MVRDGRHVQRLKFIDVVEVPPSVAEAAANVATNRQKSACVYEGGSRRLAVTLIKRDTTAYGTGKYSDFCVVRRAIHAGPPTKPETATE